MPQFDMLMTFAVVVCGLAAAALLMGWIFSGSKFDPGPSVTPLGDGGASEAYAAKVDAEQGARAARRADWTDAGGDGD